VRVEQIGDATLYLGDAREIVPGLGGVDLVLADPPYGIGFGYASYEDTRANLIALISDVVIPSIGISRRAAFTPGQTQISLYPPPRWVSAVIWDTTGSFGYCGYSQWMPVLVYGDDVGGFGRTGSGVMKSDVIRFTGGAGVGFQRDAGNDHPCPKPENVIQAIAARFSDSTDTVLDPFMGSGTTGVACARLGRRFIGVEIEPRYFDIACRRIEQAYRQRDLFVEPPPAPKPVTPPPDLFAVSE